MTTVKVMVSDDQGNTSEELLESALVANIHRQDLGELDEARALLRLLAIHGSQTALAKRLHRSRGWVSQRLALLTLTPELQARIGQELIDLLRAIAKKPTEEQEAALEALKAERARAEAERLARREAEKLAREVPQPPEPEPELEPEPQPVAVAPAAPQEPTVAPGTAQPEPSVPATRPTPPTVHPATPSAPAPGPDAAPSATVADTAVPEPVRPLVPPLPPYGRPARSSPCAGCRTTSPARSPCCWPRRSRTTTCSSP
ncbi:ParB/RepB/Spo0J family partition protein [Streptomyces sp. NPDC001307]|uniref:ParB/RepB/Spo0J family partition protein n=1 Tax=Streptomyces sp. NPDC001307 TaxID=3364560 RepID=UPI0036A18ED8